MTFDTTNTGDNWDSFVPEPATPAPPAPGAVQQQMTPQYAAPQQASSGSGLGGVGKGVARRLIFVPVIGAFMLFGWFTTRGTTEATDLQAGDCFLMPTEGEEFERLDTEDCTLPHDGQILAAVTIAGSDIYPGDFDAYWETVFEGCQDASSAITRFDQLPDDTQLNFFSPTEESWDMGDRESLCYLSSTSGLDGSFVATTSS